VNGKFRVEQASEAQALTIWEESPQATAFNHPGLLSALSESVTWWAAWRSDDLVAVLPICRTIDGHLRPPVFAYYVGPLLNQEIHEFKYHRYWAIRQQALEALVAHLAETYAAFQFALPVGFTDVRAFDWWNHDNGDHGRFEMIPRQTVRLTGLQSSDPGTIRQGFARNRKRDLKSTESAPPEQVDDWTTSEVLALHDAPLRNQGKQVPPARRKTLQRLVEQAAEGKGKVLAYRDRNSEDLASAIVLLYGRNDANNVLCVANPAYRENGLTAWTTWQGILQARNDGFDLFDFNGANSPRRAADKHCYGARDSIYFNIRYQATHA